MLIKKKVDKFIFEFLVIIITRIGKLYITLQRPITYIKARVIFEWQ